ncbi:hypothetical protein VLK31_35570 [Variovorax sp. H27-G14]|uniref:hypothetical protein n=1 Tax=Variovorax sp. H27-G14 TaxID=3111914 RepID=UPI0038FC55F9
MASENHASGHLLLDDRAESLEAAFKKIGMLPSEPYPTNHGVWQGIFHAPSAPNRAGNIITFGISFKDFGDRGEIGGFLDFWESFICDLPGRELFICVTTSYFGSRHIFGKFYYLWEQRPGREHAWRFRGDGHPYGEAEKWTSRFPYDPLPPVPDQPIGEIR